MSVTDPSRPPGAGAPAATAGPFATPAVRQSVLDVGACLVAVGFAARVWIAVTRNYFFSDDFVHLYNILEKGFLRFTMTPFGGHLLVLRNLVFFVAFQLFGTWTEPYFWSALATHLANVALLFAVIRIATGSPLLACLGASAWGTSPIVEGSLGWYSVYGQVLGTTLVLGPMVQAFRAARDEIPLTPRRTAWWGLLLFGAANCFGTGLAIALAFPLALWILLPRRLRPAGSLRPLGVWLGVVAVEYVLATWWLGAGDGADGSGIGAVARFAVHVRPQLRMFAHLMAYGASALVLGDLLRPAAYPGILSSAIVLVLLVATGWAARRAAPPRRRAMAALLVLATACCAAIAVGRAAFFSAFFTDLARTAVEPRYHYLALVPLTVLLCLVLDEIDEALRDVPYPRATLLLAWLAFATVAWTTRSGIDHHERDRADTVNARTAIQLEARAQAATGDGSPAIVPNLSFRPTRISGWDFPGLAGVYLVFLGGAKIDGRPVVFAAPEAAIATTRDGSRPRLAQILVPIEPLVDRWSDEERGAICLAEREPLCELPLILSRLAGPGDSILSDLVLPDQR